MKAVSSEILGNSENHQEKATPPKCNSCQGLVLEAGYWDPISLWCLVLRRDWPLLGIALGTMSHVLCPCSDQWTLRTCCEVPGADLSLTPSIMSRYSCSTDKRKSDRVKKICFFFSEPYSSGQLSLLALHVLLGESGLWAEWATLNSQLVTLQSQQD